MGRNCSSAATAVTPTSPPSTAAMSLLHHWCFTHIAVSSRPLCSCFSPTPGELEAADLLSALAGRHDDRDLISLMRQPVNTPHPTMRTESGVSENRRIWYFCDSHMQSHQFVSFNNNFAKIPLLESTSVVALE